MPTDEEKQLVQQMLALGLKTGRPACNAPAGPSQQSATRGSSTNGNASAEPQPKTGKVTYGDCMEYLQAIKQSFAGSGRDDVYDDFLAIIKECNDGRVDTASVVAHVAELFRGHEDLMAGFTMFLPKAACRDDAAHEPDYDKALNFIHKVQVRFPHDRVYKAFLQVLDGFRTRQKSTRLVYGEVAVLFKDHKDLLMEFAFFLPIHEPSRGHHPLCDNNIPGASRPSLPRSAAKSAAAAAAGRLGPCSKARRTGDSTDSPTSAGSMGGATAGGGAGPCSKVWRTGHSTNSPSGRIAGGGNGSSPGKAAGNSSGGRKAWRTGCSTDSPTSIGSMAGGNDQLLGGSVGEGRLIEQECTDDVADTRTSQDQGATSEDGDGDEEDGDEDEESMSEDEASERVLKCLRDLKLVGGP